MILPTVYVFYLQQRADCPFNRFSLFYPSYLTNEALDSGGVLTPSESSAPRHKTIGYAITSFLHCVKKRS